MLMVCAFFIFCFLLSTHADRHVVDISFTVCFCVCVCPHDFGNGYLRRGLT